MKTWKASEFYSAAAVREVGEDAVRVTAGYLLRLAKGDPKCTRRDERRAIVPLATAIHGLLWKIALARTAALPADTDRQGWIAVVEEMVTAAANAHAEKAAAARKARAGKNAAPAADTQSESPATEAPAIDHELNPVRAAVAGLIAAIAGLPPAERAAAARKVCQVIMQKFE